MLQILMFTIIILNRLEIKVTFVITTSLSLRKANSTYLHIPSQSKIKNIVTIAYVVVTCYFNFK